MPKKIPEHQLSKRFWKRKAAAEVLPSKDAESLEGKAEKIEKDIRKNWLRYLILAIIIGAMEWAVLEKIHSIGYTHVRDERDSLLKQVAEYKQKAEATKQPLHEAGVRPIDARLAEQKAAGAGVMPSTRQVQKASTAVGKATQPPVRPLENAKAALVEAGALSSSSGQVADQKPSINCSVAKAHLAAILSLNERVGADPRYAKRYLVDTSTQELLRPHVAALADIFSADKTLKDIARDLPSSFDKNVLYKSASYAKAVVEGLCPTAVSEVDKTKELQDMQRRQCAAIERISRSLRGIREQTEAETILTSKHHLVDLFNKALDESKKELGTDALITSFAPAENYTWFAETQKYLLVSISALEVRLQTLGESCAKTPVSP